MKSGFFTTFAEARPQHTAMLPRQGYYTLF